MKKFLIRTLSATVYAALIVFAIYGRDIVNPNRPLVGFSIFVAITFLFAMIGVWEVYHNFALAGKSSDKVGGMVACALTFLVLSAANFYKFRFPEISLQMMAWLIIFAVWACLPFRQLWRKDADPMETLGRTMLPLVWVVVPMLMLQFIGNRSLGLLMMVFVCTWANDTGAYLTGMAIGRHPLWQRHSPKKTWEGTLGGVVLCGVAAAFIGPLLVEGLAWWYWLLVALVCAVCGTLGDLVESMFKRSCGVKDSGTIMPGHGGMLDRFDSILLIAPFVASLIAFGSIL